MQPMPQGRPRILLQRDLCRLPPQGPFRDFHECFVFLNAVVGQFVESLQVVLIHAAGSTPKKKKAGSGSGIYALASFEVPRAEILAH